MMGWRDDYAKLIGQYPHKCGAELGVLRGLNAVTLLSRLPGLELLYCVDHWNNERTMASYFEAIKLYRSRVKTMHMKTDEAASKVADESLDFVFIDAHHTYESVVNDVTLWAPKVKKAGIISGHDYIDYKKIGAPNPSNYNVKKAIDELFPSAMIKGTVWWSIKE